MANDKKLLAIVELGGYPNFTALYESCGYQVTMAHAMRKAMAIVRKEKPDVIVAEFNYQSDFRDRTSTLESLLATVERLQQTHSKTIRVIVFYEKEYQHQLEKLQAMFVNFDPLPYPVQEEALKQHILSSDSLT
ncbi:hypothetical protein [Kaarinaea lacus]